MGSATELLDEILARPDDDAPRLAYADLLVAEGDPRGELIRIQCRLAQPPRDDDSKERMALYARGKVLLDAHGAEWEAPFARARCWSTGSAASPARSSAAAPIFSRCAPRCRRRRWSH